MPEKLTHLNLNGIILISIKNYRYQLTGKLRVCYFLKSSKVHFPNKQNCSTFWFYSKMYIVHITLIFPKRNHTSIEINYLKKSFKMITSKKVIILTSKLSSFLYKKIQMTTYYSVDRKKRINVLILYFSSN